MEKFKESLITNAGRKMLLGLGAGSSQLTYTKAVLYDQDLSSMDDDQIRALTTLSGEKLSTEIKQVKVKDNTVIAYAVFQNADLVDDVTFRAVGWYAKSSIDGQERLLAVSQSIGTQTIASGSPDHRSTAEVDINLAMAISDSVNVTVQIDPTGMVNNRDLDNAINIVKIELEDKIAKAGQVKSVTMNSAKHDPDSSGNINLGDTLLPGLTAVTVGSDDVDIVYKSGKNRYTADITNALNNVINSAINSSRLTDEQKKAIGITYGDVSTSGSSYATVSKQATYSDTYHSFKLDNSGTVEALNQLDGKTDKALQKVADLTPDELPNNTDLNTVKDAKDYGLSGINVTNAPYTSGVWGVLSVYATTPTVYTTTPTNGLQVFTEANYGEVYIRVWHNTNVFTKWEKLANTDDIKVSSVNGKTGDVNIDTVDTVSIVDGSNVTFSDFMGVGGDTSAPDMKLTQSSSKTNATTLVSETAFEKVTQQLGQALKLFNSIASTNYSGLSDDIANIKANYATKQWVTDNFMPKPYITNSSSTADTYSKAHPDQLVILTK